GRTSRGARSDGTAPASPRSRSSPSRDMVRASGPGTARRRPGGVARCTPMDLELFHTPGLGDSTYLLASGGEAVLVDPQRDAWRFVEAAQQRGWRIRHVLETHVHNDYVSGALETRAATDAEIVAPARGAYEFAHRPVDEGDWVEIGGLRLTAWATPGHTPEHLAWVVSDVERSDAPTAVFTGGSLLVGSVGR